MCSKFQPGKRPRQTSLDVISLSEGLYFSRNSAMLLQSLSYRPGQKECLHKCHCAKKSQWMSVQQPPDSVAHEGRDMSSIMIVTNRNLSCSIYCNTYFCTDRIAKTNSRNNAQSKNQRRVRMYRKVCFGRQDFVLRADTSMSEVTDAE
jgi:hypothetical protein